MHALPLNAITHFDSLVASGFASAAIELDRQVKEFEQDARRRGVQMGSGAFDTKLAAVFVGALKRSSAILYESAVQVHRDFNLPNHESVQSQLVGVAEKNLSARCLSLQGSYGRYFERRGSVARHDSGLQMKHELLAASLFNAVGEYFRRQRELPVNRQQAQATVHIVNNGTIGILQTGDQAFGVYNAAPVTQALDNLAAAIDADNGAQANLKADAHKALNELRAALANENPETSNLQQLLDVLAMTVQGLAAAEPAYAALRGLLLTTFGV
jgi:hypothetical protein